MKLIICFLGLLCLFLKAGAQEKITSRGLEPGNQLPETGLIQLVNYETETAHIADFKGKLLILDFWSTFCAGCIWAMPHLDSLQRQFKGQVVILPVAFEKRERVTTFWKQNPLLKGLRLLSVVEDRQLQALFPHRLLPHDVWIDGQGRVLGLTTAADISADRIRGVLAGKPLAVINKQDALNYDREKPLLVDHNGGNDNAFCYRSLITGYLRGLPASLRVQVDSLRHQIRVRATNVSPARLYTLAYQGLAGLSAAAVGGSAKNILFPVGTGASRDTVHAYCYELILPGNSVSLARRSIREDLDRFFGVRTTWDRETKQLTVEPLDNSFYRKENFSLY